MKIQVYTFAIPTVIFMDLISDSVDFPWWAYLFLVIGVSTRYYRINY